MEGLGKSPADPLLLLAQEKAEAEAAANLVNNCAVAPLSLPAALKIKSQCT